MGYEDFTKILENVLGLLGKEGGKEKAQVIIAKAIALTQLADVAIKGFNELKELSGQEDITQAELMDRFAKNDVRMQDAIDKIKNG